MKRFLPTGLIVGALLPSVASAHNIQNVYHIMQHVREWLLSIVPVAIGGILIVVFWNIGRFVLSADDEREREKYKQYIVWSVVGLFGIVAFWGIAYAILGSFFGTTDPRLNTPGYVNSSGVRQP